MSLVYIPSNGHLLVTLDTIDSEKKSKILIPDSAAETRAMQEFEAVRLVGAASECYSVGTKLIVEGNFLRQITITGVTYYLIHEKYVLMHEELG